MTTTLPPPMPVRGVHRQAPPQPLLHAEVQEVVGGAISRLQVRKLRCGVLGHVPLPRPQAPHAKVLSIKHTDPLCRLSL